MADFVAPGSPATRLVAQLRAKPPKKKKAPANKPPAPPVPAGPAPGTIDPVTGFITTATSTGRRRRDLTAEIQTQFANVAAMVTTTETFDRVHFRPIALSTQEKLDIAKRLWTEWFTLLYASVEKAEATLAKDAPFPPLAEVKHFIYFLATKGKSGLGVEQGGWSMHTTRTFLGRIFSMLRRCFTKEPPKYDRTQLYSAISNWAFVDKALTTRKRPKRIVREVDLVELLAVALKTSVKISSNFSRITIMGLITYLFTHGHRIGSLVEAKGYEGRGEHLKWRDIEFVAYGWDPEAGLGIQQFAVMHWCKGMRFDESLNVTTNMRNLGRSRIHIDPCLLIEALAVQADVFEQDLLVLRATDPALLEFPFTLKMKKSALDQPVFLNAEKTGALTENAAYHLLVKLRKALNWSNFVFTTLRYSYASTMTDRVPKTHLRYLMGHTRGSSLSITTYQAPDRPVDISGSRFDEEGAHFAAMAQAHSSVAWNRAPPLSDAKITEDPKLSALIAEGARRETLVQQKFPGKCAEELYREGKNDPLILDALDILAETLEYYLSLSGSHRPLPSKAPSTSKTTNTPSSMTDSSPPVASSSTSPTYPALISLDAPTSGVHSTHASSTGTHQPTAIDPALDPASTITSDGENALFNSMLNAWSTIDDSHPFLAVVAREPHNPRLAVLQRYMALLRLDDELLPGRCVWCFTDPTLAPEIQNKDHTEHYIQHVTACELKHNPNTWRCMVCTELVPIVPKRSKNQDVRLLRDRIPTLATAVVDDDMEEEERQSIHEAFERHCEGCFERLLVVVRGDGDEEEDVEEPEEEEPQQQQQQQEGAGKDADTGGEMDVDVEPVRGRSMSKVPRGRSQSVAMSSGRDSDVSMASVRSHTSLLRSKQTRNVAVPDREDGARVLSIRVPLDAGRPQDRDLRLHSFFFCPKCLWDEDLEWSIRLATLSNVPKLMTHLATHWKPGAKTAGIGYDLKFSCNFPECLVLRKMKTKEFIEHLHKVHRYNLIQCTTHCTDDTDCDPQKCGEDHHDSTCFTLPENFLFHNDALVLASAQMPADKRVPLPSATLVEFRKTDVQKRAQAALFQHLEVTPFEFKAPGKRRAKKKGLADGDNVAAADFFLRRCILAVAGHQEFAEIDVEELVKAKISAFQLAQCAKDEIPSCGVTFTPPRHSRFIKAVKEWLVSECVTMLVDAYPGVVTADLAPKLIADLYTVDDLVASSAADLVQYGMSVADPVWTLMKGSVQGWAADNGAPQ